MGCIMPYTQAEQATQCCCTPPNWGCVSLLKQPAWRLSCAQLACCVNAHARTSDSDVQSAAHTAHILRPPTCHQAHGTPTTPSTCLVCCVINDKRCALGGLLLASDTNPNSTWVCMCCCRAPASKHPAAVIAADVGSLTCTAGAVRLGALLLHDSQQSHAASGLKGVCSPCAPTSLTAGAHMHMLFM